MCVTYHVPPPPQISEGEDADEDTEFLTRVKNSCSLLTGSLRRSDTSSATLPVTWSNSSLEPSTESSRDSLGISSSTDSPTAVQGPVILLGDNFDPQVMTEDYQVCPPPYSSTSASLSTSESGSMFYATFIPDSCVLEDEVSIVCNGFTQIETDSHNTTTGSESEDQQVIPAEAVSKEKAWTSSVKLPTLLDFWERRNNTKECQFKKYASESNISKNQELPENGLRKIPKEKNFTSCEESFNEESDYSVRSGYEDHIYQRIDTEMSPKRTVSLLQEESGFFSYENNTASKTPEENRNNEGKENYYEDDLSEPTYACIDWSRDSLRDCENSSDNNVTIIAVDFNHTNMNNNNNNTMVEHDKPATTALTTSVKDLRKLFESNSAQQVTFSNSTVKEANTFNIPCIYFAF